MSLDRWCANVVWPEGKLTCDGMAVIRLDLVLSAGHVLDEFLDPLSTLAGISVPRQSGSGTIELGEILCSSRRIIGGIIETCEVVGRAGRYLDTAPAR